MNLIQDLGLKPFLLKGHVSMGNGDPTPISFFLDLGKERSVVEMSGISVIREGRLVVCKNAVYNDNWFESIKSFRLIAEVGTDRIYTGTWTDPFMNQSVVTIFTVRHGQLKFATEFHSHATFDVRYSEKITDPGQFP